MKKGRLILILGLALFSFMLLSLLMMSLSLKDSEQFGGLFNYLLAFNSFGILLLIVLIVLNFRRLARELKHRVAGAVMTLRMVLLFSLLSVVPVLVLYYFSLDFLLRGIDNWFDLRVEQALDDSLELSRLALDGRMREFLKQTEQAANDLGTFSDTELPFEIESLMENSVADEFTVFSKQGNVLSTNTGNKIGLVPEKIDDTILLQLQQGISYVGLDPVNDDTLAIRVVVNIPSGILGQEEKYIQALYPVDERINTLADSVQDAYVQYQELSYLREQLKLSFVMILTIVLLFSIFSVVWAAFYSAKQLAAPIRDLAEGTRAIAAGEYDKEIPVTSHDELGFLVASFNKMRRHVGQAQEQAHMSKIQAEEQHARLQAVLSNLSSGVMVFSNDGDISISNCNDSAATILGLTLNELLHKKLTEISQQFPNRERFFQCVQENIASANNEWRQQLSLLEPSGKKELMISGANIVHHEFTESATVVVFDDITAVIQGQKDAAWSEVARRLAHEIKNPLTPIQLAAERLRHKYGKILEGDDIEVLNRLTGTIVQQVDTMKEMVNNFADYAITTAGGDTPSNINDLVQAVIDLYSNNKKSIKIESAYMEDLPSILANPKRLTQVMNNLVKNAIEVSEPKSTILVSTTLIDSDTVELRVRDSGTGIDDNIRDKIFEPYVTSKTKGTGLGLAIVKKIIEEHGGTISLENNADGKGASAYIHLPLPKNQPPGKTV